MQNLGSIKINEEEFDLSYKFDDLHDICYREIMAGRGLDLMMLNKVLK